MAMLTVRNLPDDVHRALRVQAALHGRSTEAEVREHCKLNLTGYKLPRVVEFRADLPKTPVGKVLRRELRDHK